VPSPDGTWCPIHTEQTEKIENSQFKNKARHAFLQANKPTTSQGKGWNAETTTTIKLNRIMLFVIGRITSVRNLIHATSIPLKGRNTYHVSKVPVHCLYHTVNELQNRQLVLHKWPNEQKKHLVKTQPSLMIHSAVPKFSVHLEDLSCWVHIYMVHVVDNFHMSSLEHMRVHFRSPFVTQRQCHIKRYSASLWSPEYSIICWRGILILSFPSNRPIEY